MARADRLRAVLDRRSHWALIRGDCMRVLPRIPARAVDCVVADPPYGISYQSHQNASRRFGILTNDDHPFIWWLHEAARVLRPGGALLCFCRPDVQEDFRRAIALAGLVLRSQVIWDRARHGAGNCASTFGPRHDVIWFATKGRFAFPTFRPVSVIRCLAPHWSKARHPTQKPIGLLRQLIGAVSRRADLILDPTAGVGSTGVAALQLGRRFLGIELDRTYASVARTRLGACGRL